MKNPRYNIRTRKIYDCKKNSFAYYHEYRHKTHHERDLLSKFLMYFRYPSTIIGGYRWGSDGFDIYTLSLLIPITFFVYLELDAHLYALRQFYKNEPH